jgi:hypothetical protein
MSAIITSAPESGLTAFGQLRSLFRFPPFQPFRLVRGWPLAAGGASRDPKRPNWAQWIDQHTLHPSRPGSLGLAGHAKDKHSQAFFFSVLDFARTAFPAFGLAALAFAGVALAKLVFAAVALVDFALPAFVPATLPASSLAAFVTVSTTLLAAFSTFEVVVVLLAIARLGFVCDQLVQVDDIRSDGLNSAHRQQDNDDDQHDTEAAAWRIAPAATVAPGRQATYQQQNENDEQDGTECHGPCSELQPEQPNIGPRASPAVLRLVHRLRGLDAEAPVLRPRPATFSRVRKRAAQVVIGSSEPTGSCRCHRLLTRALLRRVRRGCQLPT